MDAVGKGCCAFSMGVVCAEFCPALDMESGNGSRHKQTSWRKQNLKLFLGFVIGLATHGDLIAGRFQANKGVNTVQTLGRCWIGSEINNRTRMRNGLEKLRFLSRRGGCVWTNIPDYGKISSLNLEEIINE